MEQLILLLGDATPKRLITPQLSRHTSGLSTPRRSTSSLNASTSAITASAPAPFSPHIPGTAFAVTTGANAGPAAAATPSAGPSTSVTPGAASQQSQAPPHPPSGISLQANAGAQTTTAGLAALPTGKAAHGTSVSAGDASVAAVAGETEAAGITPMGAITSTGNSTQAPHSAAPSEGPSGSLVSVQPTAAQPSAYGDSIVTDEEQLQSASYIQAPAQHGTAQHAPLMSPAAEPDVQQQQHASSSFAMPSADDITPQNSSTQVDAHIAAAPTPYPSLASGWSQPNSPKTPQTDAGQMSALSRALETAAGAQPGSPVSNSQLAEKTGAQEASAASHGTSRLGQEASGTQGVSTAAESAPEQEAEALPADLQAADLKLDEADSEQLQAALALSLDTDTAEQLADDLASTSINDDPITGSSNASDMQTTQTDNPSSRPAAASYTHQDAVTSAAATSGSNSIPAQPAQPPQQSLAEGLSDCEEVQPPELIAGPLHSLPQSHQQDSTANAEHTHITQQASQPDRLEEHELGLLTPSNTGTAGTPAAVHGTHPADKGPQTPSGDQSFEQSRSSSLSDRARQQSAPGTSLAMDTGMQALLASEHRTACYC